jgi:hypothetical protein
MPTSSGEDDGDAMAAFVGDFGADSSDDEGGGLVRENDGHENDGATANDGPFPMFGQPLVRRQPVDAHMAAMQPPHGPAVMEDVLRSFSRSDAPREVVALYTRVEGWCELAQQEALWSNVLSTRAESGPGSVGYIIQVVMPSQTQYGTLHLILCCCADTGITLGCHWLWGCRYSRSL